MKTQHARISLKEADSWTKVKAVRRISLLPEKNVFSTKSSQLRTKLRLPDFQDPLIKMKLWT